MIARKRMIIWKQTLSPIAFLRFFYAIGQDETSCWKRSRKSWTNLFSAFTCRQNVSKRDRCPAASWSSGGGHRGSCASPGSRGRPGNRARRSVRCAPRGGRRCCAAPCNCASWGRPPRRCSRWDSRCSSRGRTTAWRGAGPPSGRSTRLGRRAGSWSSVLLQIEPSLQSLGNSKAIPAPEGPSDTELMRTKNDSFKPGVTSFHVLSL